MLRSFFLGLTALWWVLAGIAAAGDFDLPEDEIFQKHANFWIGIYGIYSTHQGVVHDADHLDRIYEIVDFSNSTHRQANHLVLQTKRKWRKTLLNVQHKIKTPEKMNEDEVRVFKLFPESEGPTRYADAASRRRLRFQLGQKEMFRSALIQSGRYLPLMEEIFKAEGIPVEITRLPFVESSFNLEAKSKVGASGIWQFMRTTGKFFLRIDPFIDERNDPIRATEAAARLLKQNYDSLQSWPLAVVAYNHGRMGMMRAASKVGSSELKEVLSRYKSRTFGFASRNFFWELIAAIHVEKEQERYFGKLEKMTLAHFTPVVLQDFVSLPDLARALTLQPDELKRLNPAFSPPILRGKARIPRGYPVRIPEEWGKDRGGTQQAFDAAYQSIPERLKYQRQR